MPKNPTSMCEQKRRQVLVLGGEKEDICDRGLVQNVAESKPLSG